MMNFNYSKSQPVSQRISRLLILSCVDKQFSQECDTWTRKTLKESSYSVRWRGPEGWTCWLRTVFISSHLEGFQKWTSCCNDVLTNKTKALVYGQTQEASLVRVQDSGTMAAILGQNTFEFSFRVMGDERSSERTLISEGTMARGRPLCHPLQCYLSCVTCCAAERSVRLSASHADHRGSL